MYKLNKDLIILILKYFSNDICCCELSDLKNISILDKYFNNIVYNNFKFNNYLLKVPNDKIKFFNNFICLKCCPLKKNSIMNFLHTYNNHKRKIEIFSLDERSKINNSIYFHFSSCIECENFESFCKNNFNIELGNKCCGGVGIEIKYTN